jgi:hypothetical protein
LSLLPAPRATTRAASIVEVEGCDLVAMLDEARAERIAKIADPDEAELHEPPPFASGLDPMRRRGAFDPV